MNSSSNSKKLERHSQKGCLLDEGWQKLIQVVFLAIGDGFDVVEDAEGLDTVGFDLLCVVRVLAEPHTVTDLLQGSWTRISIDRSTSSHSSISGQRTQT